MAKARAERLSESEIVLWQDAVESLRFLKRQQWAVTNYAALLYASAIFLFSQDWLSGWYGRRLLVLVIAAVAVINTLVLWDLQNSMDNKFRPRIRKMYEKGLPDWPELQETRDVWRDRAITILLTIFTLIAAVLIGFVVLFRDPPPT
jgi:hypothetical protein